MEGVHALVDVVQSRLTWLLDMAATRPWPSPDHRPTRGDHAVDIGLLNDGHQAFSAVAARLQEAGEVAALSLSFGNFQRNAPRRVSSPGPRYPLCAAPSRHLECGAAPRKHTVRAPYRASMIRSAAQGTALSRRGRRQPAAQQSAAPFCTSCHRHLRCRFRSCNPNFPTDRGDRRGTAGRALRYAKGSARGLLIHHLA